MTVALSWLGFIALVVCPIAVMRYLGARWRWFLFGILSWIIGVVLKYFLQRAWDATIAPTVSQELQAIISGLISAFTELGAAACFMWWAKLRLPDALAFGVGIGVFEVLFVLLMGWLEGLEKPGLSLSERFSFVGGMFLLERMLAMIGHIGSRLLIYIGVRLKWLPPLFLAMVLFSLVDGLAMYGVLAKWNWEDAMVQTWFYLVVGVTAFIEAGLTWWFGRKVPEWSPITIKQPP